MRVGPLYYWTDVLPGDRHGDMVTGGCSHLSYVLQTTFTETSLSPLPFLTMLLSAVLYSLPCGTFSSLLYVKHGF